MYVYVPLYLGVYSEGRTLPGSELSDAPQSGVVDGCKLPQWVLGTKLRSSVVAECALNC